MKKHFEQQAKILSEAANSLDYELAEKLTIDCLSAIKNGNAIIATALGKNVPLCEKFIGTLNSLGISGKFMHTNSAVHGDLGIIKDGDLLIILSKSGETEETIYLCKLLEKRNTVNWLITGQPDSTAGKLIKNNLVFKIQNEGDPWNLVPNNSSLIFLSFLV